MPFLVYDTVNLVDVTILSMFYIFCIQACGILKERLAPIRDELGPDATWTEIIAKANEKDVDLCARYL